MDTRGIIVRYRVVNINRKWEEVRSCSDYSYMSKSSLSEGPICNRGTPDSCAVESRSKSVACSLLSLGTSFRSLGP